MDAARCPIQSAYPRELDAGKPWTQAGNRVYCEESWVSLCIRLIVDLGNSTLITNSGGEEKVYSAVSLGVCVCVS